MPEIPPLVREAMKKAGVVWVAAAGTAHAQACWQHWNGAASYLVTGPGEQPLNLVAGGTCTVTARSAGTGGRIATWAATIDAVEPGSEEWNEVVPALVAGRLNAPDSGTIAQRWAQQNTVLRLVPTGELLPDETPAAAPIPTPATTPFRMPANMGKRVARLRRKRRSRG